MNKKIITSLLCCALLSSVMSYAQKFDKPDKSPVDITYLTTRNVPKPLIKVVYGRPQKESDHVFFSSFTFLNLRIPDLGVNFLLLLYVFFPR